MDKYNFDYTISIPPVITDIQSSLNIIKSTPFRVIEVPGVWLESSDLTKGIDFSSFCISGVTDIIAPSVSNSIADQKDNIIKGFIEKLILLTEQLKEYGINEFSLNAGVEGSFSNSAQINSRISLLKKIAPYLHRKKLKLSIPVRVPSATSIPKGKYGVFLKNTMSRNIRLALNIHPHETTANGKPEDILNEFRFFIESISFVYESETGNMLVEKLIKPWFRTLDEFGYKGPVIFRPRVSNLDNLRTAVNNLSELLKLK